jgi:ATP-binding cassette subfamily D (ALD) long-chain fatty acid import protein
VLARARKSGPDTFFPNSRAIAQGSWKYWVRWLVNFCGWTAGGVLVNTGLKYTEALIELELRQRLTEKAHSIYMRDNR